MRIQWTSSYQWLRLQYLLIPGRPVPLSAPIIAISFASSGLHFEDDHRKITNLGNGSSPGKQRLTMPNSPFETDGVMVTMKLIN
jgi:hypothetical protein